jgi:hypothetical protein
VDKQIDPGTAGCPHCSSHEISRQKQELVDAKLTSLLLIYFKKKASTSYGQTQKRTHTNYRICGLPLKNPGAKTKPHISMTVAGNFSIVFESFEHSLNAPSCD